MVAFPAFQGHGSHCCPRHRFSRGHGVKSASAAFVGTNPMTSAMNRDTSFQVGFVMGGLLHLAVAALYLAFARGTKHYFIITIIKISEHMFTAALVWIGVFLARRNRASEGVKHVQEGRS